VFEEIILYLKNSFVLSVGAGQRLFGVLAAVLIPSILCLSLMRNHIVVTEHFTQANSLVTFLQLYYLAKPSPPDAVLELEKRTNTKVMIRQTSGNLLAKEAANRNQEKSVTASLKSSSFEVIETDLANQVSLATEVASDALVRQYKGKSAVGAYQDIRSDIQKMADRKGVSLQAERANKYEVFQAAANEAAIPDCLARGTSSKLSLDSFKGLLVIPALAAAAATGKCK
jgi:hypothetical protein